MADPFCMFFVGKSQKKRSAISGAPYYHRVRIYYSFTIFTSSISNSRAENGLIEPVSRSP